MIPAQSAQAMLASPSQVETNKDKQLQRRVQSLQRFLMTRLKAELAQRAPPQPASPRDSSQAIAGGRAMLLQAGMQQHASSLKGHIWP